MNLFARFMPDAVREWKRAVDATRPLHPRTCPLCSFQGEFRHAGRPPRLDALCPRCSSMERHRLQWLYLRDAALQGPVIHAAPEPCLSSRLRARFGTEYRTSDLYAPADMKLNLEALALEDGSVGAFICNHVLEHVDDRKALAELHRTLKPGGKLVCSVPMVYGWERTYEDPAITEPHARELHFGQDDHVRFYGRDFVTRLQAAGFEVEEHTAEGADCVTYGLLRGEKFHVCTRL